MIEAMERMNFVIKCIGEVIAIGVVILSGSLLGKNPASRIFSFSVIRHHPFAV